jgi:hypothetical protein
VNRWRSQSLPGEGEKGTPILPPRGACLPSLPAISSSTRQGRVEEEVALDQPKSAGDHPDDRKDPSAALSPKVISRGLSRFARDHSRQERAYLASILADRVPSCMCPGPPGIGARFTREGNSQLGLLPCSTRTSVPPVVPSRLDTCFDTCFDPSLPALTHPLRASLRRAGHRQAQREGERVSSTLTAAEAYRAFGRSRAPNPIVSVRAHPARRGSPDPPFDSRASPKEGCRPSKAIN